MRMALKMAELGRGYVSPNPLVGAVIAQGERIVGVGYHRRYGDKHAEVRALEDAGESARGGTMYVTLEPHNFHGHQPPCTEAIIRAGIKKVIVGELDPNPKVKGRGVRRLKEAGIEVVVGVLREEVRKQNESFFTFHEKGRPFVALKMALSADGRLADTHGHSRWITGPEARRKVHILRSYHDAILVGAGTVRADDPLLTVRLVFTERQPLRVVVSRSGKIPCNARIFSGDVPTLLLSVGNVPCDFPEGVEVERFSGDVWGILKALYRRGITSLLVEGGGEIFTVFLESVVDRIYLFMAPKFLGGKSGPFKKILPVSSPMEFLVEDVEKVGEDVLIHLVPPSKMEREST